MKRKYSNIISVLLIFVIIISASPVKKLIDDFKINNKVEECRPSQQEIEMFNKQVEEDTCYYYNNLNNKEKEAYRTMYVSLMNFEESFYIDVALDDLKDLFMSVLYDNSHIFWVKSSFTYTEYDNAIMFTPEYRHTVSEAEKITKDLNKKIEEIIAPIKLLETDYKKELYIHNYVCENTDYIEKSDKYIDTAYEALLNGNALCEGYARAIQILLDAVDIDNYLIIGNGITEESVEPHMWNIVKIDGEYYHLDATWDDSSMTDMVLYFYFNVTDSFISEDHKDFNIEYTNCVSNSANYFVVENAVVESYNGFTEHIDRTADTLKKGKNNIEFYFKSSDDMLKAVRDISNDNNFFNYISSAIYKSGRNLNAKEIEYYTLDKYNYLCIVLEEG